MAIHRTPRVAVIDESALSCHMMTVKKIPISKTGIVLHSAKMAYVNSKDDLHYSSGETTFARIYSRFNLAICATEISFGHSASHA